MLKIKLLPPQRCNNLDDVAVRSRCTFRSTSYSLSPAWRRLQQVMSQCCDRCAECSRRSELMTQLAAVEGPMLAVSRALRDDLGRRSVSSTQVSCGGATVAVHCPITLQRLRVPCRTIFCCHPAVFDAASFLHCCLHGLAAEEWDAFRGADQENGRPTASVGDGSQRTGTSIWRCPVCSVAVGPLLRDGDKSGQQVLIILDEALFSALGSVDDGDRLEIRSGDIRWRRVPHRNERKKRRVETCLDDPS